MENQHQLHSRLPLLIVAPTYSSQRHPDIVIMTRLSLLLLQSTLVSSSLAFAPTSNGFTVASRVARTELQSSSNDDAKSDDSSSTTPTATVDVSDLGVTMDELNAPLPEGFWDTMETSGYESTSRIPSVDDQACFWTETEDSLSVVLNIPGLRGQPPACLAPITADNTLTLTAFGYVVWSCVMRGTVQPDTVQFTARDGPDMVPVIEYTVQKTAGSARWGGFIEQIGENSIL